MNNLKTFVICILIAFIVGGLGGGGLVYHFYKPVEPKLIDVVSKPQMTNKDGSTNIQRTPELAKDVKVPTDVPKGNKATEVITLTVHDTVTKWRKDTVIYVSKTGDTIRLPCPEHVDTCPGVKIALTLSDGKSGKTVTAKSETGIIYGALDIPIVERTVPAPVKKWTAGVIAGYDFGSNKSIDVFGLRKIGPVAVGLAGGFRLDRTNQFDSKTIGGKIILAADF